MTLTYCGTEFCGLKFTETSTKEGNPTLFKKILSRYFCNNHSNRHTASITITLNNQRAEQGSMSQALTEHLFLLITVLGLRETVLNDKIPTL